MAGQSFRFLHTGGFQLASTLQGLAHVPEHLRDELIAAPQKAAQAVFDAALREEVDFVVFSGDILDPGTAGPAAVTLLLHRLEQLGEQRITVYWAASKRDLAGDFLFQLGLPDNVHVFPRDHIERITHFRGEYPVATLLGRSWSAQRPLRAGEFAREAQEGFQLAVLFEPGDVLSTRPESVNYWALGGPATPDQPTSNRRSLIHSPGSPQGRGPDNPGPHGCTLVSVDGEGEIRTRRIETAPVRWCRESIELDSTATLRDARQEFRNRIERDASESSPIRLVAWKLVGEACLETPLARRREQQELLEWLRNDYGHRSPPVWSVSLELEPPETISPDWSDDDSILGDFLRAVQQQLERREDDKPVDLQAYLPRRKVSREITEALAMTDRATVLRAVREAAVLGFDLLRGEDARNRPKSKYASRVEKEGMMT
jgi:DNA repair exonuclease SbcCD nuclease subunit